MACLFPRTMRIKKKDGNTIVIPVPCGRCPKCLSKTRQEWYIRNKVELLNAENAFFVTLTYNNEHLPYSNANGLPCFSVDDIQKFLKRFRKQLNYTKFKYFLASEYGDQFGRPHYHALFYNIPYEKISSLSELLAKTWSLGFTSVSPVTDRRIGYVCKYMLQRTQRKKDFTDPAQAPFYLASRRPAIGSSYLTVSNILHHLSNKSITFNLFGLKTSLPSYYKRKIFDGYEHIKEEIRNEYLKSLKKHHDDIGYSHDAIRSYSEFVHQTTKNTLRRFKKYQKEHFGLESQFITDNLKN